MDKKQKYTELRDCDGRHHQGEAEHREGHLSPFGQYLHDDGPRHQGQLREGEFLILREIA